MAKFNAGSQTLQEERMHVISLFLLLGVDLSQLFYVKTIIK